MITWDPSSLAIAGVCVAVLNAYAATLVVLRGKAYGVPIYRPMLRNIVLSLIPVALAAVGTVAGSVAFFLLLTVPEPWSTVIGLTALFLVALVWLLFYPNSAYLITELNFSHRRDGDPVPLWFDIISTLTLTMSGIANSIVSLAFVQSFAVLLLDLGTSHSIPFSVTWVLAGVVIALGSLGIYAGRYLRLNSWDVRHPISMVAKTSAYFSQPGRKGEAAAFVSTYSLFLLLLYVSVYAPVYVELVQQ